MTVNKITKQSKPKISKMVTTFVFLVPVRLLLSRMVVLYHVPTGLDGKGLLLKGCLSWTISDKLSWTIRDKQKENLTLN